MERFCHRYKYTPQQVLEMDIEWIETFMHIWELDAEKREKDSANVQIKQKLNQRING